MFDGKNKPGFYFTTRQEVVEIKILIISSPIRQFMNIIIRFYFQKMKIKYVHIVFLQIYVSKNCLMVKTSMFFFWSYTSHFLAMVNTFQSGLDRPFIFFLCEGVNFLPQFLCRILKKMVSGLTSFDHFNVTCVVHFY